jgi:hypothetical protein
MRDNFSKRTVELLTKRANYICSNPNCRVTTSKPPDKNSNIVIFTGKAVHISAASIGGPRFDQNLTIEQRSSIENGIFLCSNCAEMIDKNNGLDYSIELLNEWKNAHETWIQSNYNNTIKFELLNPHHENKINSNTELKRNISTLHGIN